MADHAAIAVNTSATTSMVVPSSGGLAGTPFGDDHTLLLAISCSSLSTAPDPGVGWTLLAASASGSSGSWIFGRKGDGTTNSVTITLPGTGTYRAWLAAYSNTWSDQLFETPVAQPLASAVSTIATGTLTASDAAVSLGIAQLSGSAGGTGFSWTNSWNNVGTTPYGGSTENLNVRDKAATVGGSHASTLTWTTARNVRLAAVTLSRRAPSAARIKKRIGLTADTTITYNQSAALGTTYGHLLFVRRESTTPIATPSGWTLEPGGGGQSGHNIWVYSKRGDGTTNSVLLDLPDASVTDAVLAAWPGILKDDFVASVDFSATSSGTSHASASVSTSEADMFAVAFGSYADAAGAVTAIGSSYKTMFGWPTTSEVFFGDRTVAASGTAVGFTATHTGGTSRTGREVVVTLSTAPDETYDGPGQFYAYDGTLTDPCYVLGARTV